MPDISLSCACGSLAGTLRAAGPREGTRLVCYCADCQAYARHLRPEAPALDAAGGTDLYQTSSGRIELATGRDRLACLRMTRRGPLRWYAACCRTPIANTAALRAVPYGSVAVGCLEDAEPLGPVLARTFAHASLTPVPRPRIGMAALGLRVLRITAAARLRGDHRQAPFFDASGAPVAAPHLLSPEERRAAYA